MKKAPTPENQLDLLLISKKELPTELQQILSEPLSSRLYKYQDLALNKNTNFSDDEICSLVIQQLEEGNYGEEIWYYLEHILCTNESKLSATYILCQSLRKNNTIYGINGYTGLSNANYLITLLKELFTSPKTPFLQKLFTQTTQLHEISFCDYIADAASEGYWIAEDNDDFLTLALNHSQYTAWQVIHLCATTLTITQTLSLTKSYCENNNYDTHSSTLRPVVDKIGCSQSNFKECKLMLNFLRQYPGLNKSIQKALTKLDRVESGLTKKYKNPILKYAPFVKSYSLMENWKNIGFARHTDSGEGFDEDFIRECYNQVREELGLHRIGEGWKNETLLYQIIKQLLKPYDAVVKHHHRPSCLAPQELDIYIKIDHVEYGVEYQGIQHYKPIKHFGGEEGLKRTQKRDKKKKEKCTKNNIQLLEYKYTTPVTDSNVRGLLRAAIKTIKI